MHSLAMASGQEYGESRAVLSALSVLRGEWVGAGWPREVEETFHQTSAL